MTRKHGPTPSSAINVPAAAGPRMREQWTTTEFSATALTTRPGPTISTTNAWRAGLSTATIVPRTSTRASTIQACTAPVSASANRVKAGTAIETCVTVNSRRLGIRSASRPPHAPNRRIGRNWSPAVRPTPTPDPVNFSISHISATICIQLPLIEMTWPVK